MRLTDPDLLLHEDVTEPSRVQSKYSKGSATNASSTTSVLLCTDFIVCRSEQRVLSVEQFASEAFWVSGDQEHKWRSRGAEVGKIQHAGRYYVITTRKEIYSYDIKILLLGKCPFVQKHKVNHTTMHI